ncbi:GlxA family transcriptional regulator [Solirhodobacter olei]|uniref:GlxA family transcriptional regulator n=1 Tax=Solirhodobacter olei TaxID=2493082 RepID=UPI000FDAA22F|nr:GlxA family transcriptional regulator [Solirhodobacter olei]
MSNEADRKFVAPGVAHVVVRDVGAPVTVTFALMPRFTLLAFTSAIEPLRVANQLAGKELFRWAVVSSDGAPVTSSCGLPVVPDGGLTRDIDTDHLLVCGGVEPESGLWPGLADSVRTQWRRGRVVGGLCTGAYALARAGILKGRRFTLHWENIAGFREVFPDLDPIRRVFCVEDRIQTCAGGVASADLMLTLIEAQYGAQLGQEVMNMCLMNRRRFGGEDQMISLAARLGTRSERVVKAVAYMEKHIEDGIDMEECAARAGITRRQLERLFADHLGTSPRQYLNDLRLQHGRALLTETNMTVLDVAIACGYVSSSHFAKSFRRKFGVTPYQFSHFGSGRAVPRTNSVEGGYGR